MLYKLKLCGFFRETTSSSGQKVENQNQKAETPVVRERVKCASITRFLTAGGSAKF
jgi:hypothetical protein